MIAEDTPARTASALAAVERALAELRRGGIVVLRDEEGNGGLAIAATHASLDMPGARALELGA